MRMPDAVLLRDRGVKSRLVDLADSARSDDGVTLGMVSGGDIDDVTAAAVSVAVSVADADAAAAAAAAAAASALSDT